jgi:hypothetical protein
MQELLKEMGVVCQNKKMAEKILSFHRDRFKTLQLMDRKKAEEHRKDYNFWVSKIVDMQKHLDQLHRKLKAS